MDQFTQNLDLYGYRATIFPDNKWIVKSPDGNNLDGGKSSNVDDAKRKILLTIRNDIEKKIQKMQEMVKYFLDV